MAVLTAALQTYLPLFFLRLMPSRGKAQHRTASFRYMKHILNASTDEMFRFDLFPTSEGSRCEIVTFRRSVEAGSSRPVDIDNKTFQHSDSAVTAKLAFFL